MAMQSSVLKPIYIAYALGSNGNKVEYEEPIKVYAQTEDVRSAVMRDDAGIIENYDRLILVPYGGKTQFIDEQTLLWVAVEPNAKKTNSDYKIERVGDVIDGSFILYCNSLTANTKSLYYERNFSIYQIKVDFDSSNLVAFLPLNKYLPVTNKTKVWTTKPSSIDSTTNLIRLVRKDRLAKSYKLTFEKVE